ncbi:MAG: glycoside hydrolase family 3 N-terminal domain-containing protein [Rubricoccaceae bacterium]|nr:glycoside hydrolase family 3 N-terminal domain-containing protein [Rubricoccaceae bacterium]
MSVQSKVGQLFVTHASGTRSGISGAERERLIDLVENFNIGGVLFFSGEATKQVHLTQELQVRSSIPLLVAQDMEFGTAMRLEDGTRFPQHMALGATRDPGLAYLMGKAVAEEARLMGIHQNYAPVADVNNNPLNPIINVRSFGENADLVGAMTSAYIRGMQDGGLIATAKHFPGHGDTETDSHAALPTLPFDRDRLDNLELQPFRGAIDAGVRSIMIGHLLLPELDPGNPATLSRSIVTELLREELGFKGLVVTDGLDMNGVRSGLGIGEVAVRALEAGVDQLILTRDEYAARASVLRAIETGRLTEDRIDASVRRVLQAKAWAGLADPFLGQPLPEMQTNNETIAVSSSSQDDQVARTIREDQFAGLRIPDSSLRRRAEALSLEIARRSITLLEKEGSPVPFVGPEAPLNYLTLILDDSENRSTGETFVETVADLAPHEATVTSRRLGIGNPESDFTEALSLVSEHEVILVPAFIRVRSWSGQIELPPRHRAFLRRVIDQGRPVVLIAMGNPYIPIGLPEPTAFVAAYGGSEDSQRAVADALFGRAAVSGRLPITIPGVYAYDQGVTLEQAVPRLGSTEEAGMSEEAIDAIEDVLDEALRARAFPGAAVSIGRDGIVVHQQGYGHYTYSAIDRVSAGSVYDLASLTKVVATTAAAMTLYEQGLLDLDERVAEYLPPFAQGGKHDVTIRQLLTHSAGQRAFYPFYSDESTQSPNEIFDFIYRDPSQYTPGAGTRYSDFDMIVLGNVIEEITGRPLDAFVTETFYEPLGMTSTGFRGTGNRDLDIVPTEVDDTFRGRLIQGEVHDEAAWMLGGVAGHAGLFSSVEDLARFAFMMANGGEAYGTRFFQPETIELFTRRITSEGRFPMALGWMTRRGEEGVESSSGRFFGPRSYGHTGFTGTSLWIDPDQKLFVILLSNRVYPSRSNQRIANVRPALADAAASRIVAPPAQPEVALGFGRPPDDLRTVSSRPMLHVAGGT